MRHLSHPAAALAALMLLAACSTDNHEEPEATGAEGDSATTATQETDYIVMDDLHWKGPGRWAITAFGDPVAPMPVVDVPKGFQGHESWVWTDLQGPRSFGQLAYWAPTLVLADPCDTGTAFRPGPTVDDLATALAAQRRTTASEPVPVTVGGHDGLYLELTTPPRDSQRCAPGDPLVIFEAGDDADRAVEWSATDRYWILEVNGHRVVITALTHRRSAPETVELLTSMVQSSQFVEAESVGSGR